MILACRGRGESSEDLENVSKVMLERFIQNANKST
jgi:hypothetical protein